MFLFSFSYSQNIENIERLDTVFVKFTGEKNIETKKEGLNKKGVNFKFYHFVKNSITFVNSKNSNIFFKKSSLANVIDNTFFDKFNDCENLENFIYKLKNKVIYIIDYTETKHGKTPICKVKPMKMICRPKLE